MKTKFFKNMLPILAFVVAIAGAFAFSNVPSTEEAVVGQFLGHYKVNGICTASQIMCQDEVQTEACENVAGAPLYKYVNSTTCSVPLWRIEQ